jgi:photosystem II stability/assembly factor-like uncharacterized protein
MSKIFPLLIFLFFVSKLFSQSIIPFSGGDILKAIDRREKMRSTSILKDYPVKNIGPVVQGGRISDIEVFPSNKQEFLIAFASGGVFYTDNDGIGFNPIFDEQGALTIGDMAIYEQGKTRVIWVGTGENNSSRSSYAGSGVYRSEDMGKTWIHCGLESIQHTGKIILHPNNPDIAWVAAMGALYSANKERGVYKTIDAGKSWSKTLFVDESTGAIDLIIHPGNPDILFASMWERKRKAWEFVENGTGSGIYASSDGGMTWAKSETGLPNGEFKGRIGLSICTKDPNIIYASLDNQKEEKKEKDKEDESKSGYKPVDFVSMSSEDFLNIPPNKIDTFLEEFGYPKKYDAKLVFKEIKKGKYNPEALGNYFGDANEALFNTKVIGAELYRSNDFGKNWKKVNKTDLEATFYSYGYYFGEVRVSPQDPETVYLLGVPLLKSIDGGETFSRADTFIHVHGDHQALWIDPENEDHLLSGNDGGLYQSYDGGAMWRNLKNVSAGQFYSIAYDFDKPYNVYGGLQDNGVLYGFNKSIPNVTKKWEWIFGGDGMMVQINPENSDEIYTGFQFGNYFRISRSGKSGAKRVVPKHDIGEPSSRFNWRTPILLSKHNFSIFYIGSQRLYQSLDKGKTLKPISPDLSKDLPSENVPYSTLTVIEESPFEFSSLFIGTDDGNIQVTEDGGRTWDLRIKGLPENLWVSSIYPSNHDQEKIYCTLNGYREDDFNSYVFKSTDLGQNWESISSQLPSEAVNKIIEDPEVPGLLFVGTDHGTYCSMDEGSSWSLFSRIPNVSSYDLAIQPREGDLLIGTHGRSAYKLNIKKIRKIAQNQNEQLLFDLEDQVGRKKWDRDYNGYGNPWIPELEISGYNPGGKELEIVIRIGKNKSQKINSINRRGYWSFSWVPEMKDKQGKTEYLNAGDYEIQLRSGREILEKRSFKIKD